MHPYSNLVPNCPEAFFLHAVCMLYAHDINIYTAHLLPAAYLILTCVNCWYPANRLRHCRWSSAVRTNVAHLCDKPTTRLPLDVYAGPTAYLQKNPLGMTIDLHGPCSFSKALPLARTRATHTRDRPPLVYNLLLAAAHQDRKDNCSNAGEHGDAKALRNIAAPPSTASVSLPICWVFCKDLFAAGWTGLITTSTLAITRHDALGDQAGAHRRTDDRDSERDASTSTPCTTFF
jgi:hypothetical protein